MTKITLKQDWRWLKALIAMNLYNQSHWWVIPVSLLLYGLVTSIQFAPYQAAHNWLGDGSLILFGNNSLRFHLLNPIYLFIVSNIGSRYHCEDFALYRLGSRLLLGLSKSIFFIIFTLVYLVAAIVCAEISSFPFINEFSQGWSDTVIGYFGGKLPFVVTHTPLTVWGSTMWFVLLSWLALGGVAFVTAQLMNRAEYGFGIAVALNWTGLMSDMAATPSGIQVLNINRPMLSFWSGNLPMSFESATLYWLIWYGVLTFIFVRHIYRSGGVFHKYRWLQYIFRSAWYVITMSLGKGWLFAILFSIISTLANCYMLDSIEINTLNLAGVNLKPILSLSGPSLDASLFSFVFLRWLLIFLVFLLIIGETAARSLWWQHTVLLPRVGSRWGWWLSNVLAIALLSFTYLTLYLGIDWVVNRVGIALSSLLFYISIFTVYWFTLILLGCSQLIILLITRSRSRVLLVMALLFTFIWVIGQNLPWLLPWLPIAQTAIIAQIVTTGTIDPMSLLVTTVGGSMICTLIGLLLVQRYEFANLLKHN